MSKITVTTVEAENVLISNQDVRVTINTAFTQANTARTQANTAISLAIAFGA